MIHYYILSCTHLTLGLTEVNLFASRNNRKLNKYASCHTDPESWRMDAFSLIWNNKFHYVFPPFSLISRVVRKIKMDHSNAILIVPSNISSQVPCHVPEEPPEPTHQRPLTVHGDMSTTPLTVFLF